MAKSKKRKTLPREDWMAIFSQPDTRYRTGKRHRAMYLMMYSLGLRVGEACYLRIGELDLERQTIWTPMEGKTGQRLLGLPDSRMFHDALEAWLDIRAEDYPSSNSEWLFCTSTGGRVSEQSVREALSRHAAKAGFTGVHPHLMRHSMATEVLSEGSASIYDLKEMLGHADVATTQIYLHSIEGRTTDLMKSRAI